MPRASRIGRSVCALGLVLGLWGAVRTGAVVPAPVRVTSVGVVVPDVDAAAGAWARVFGVSVDAPMDEAGGRMATVHLPNLAVELWHPSASSPGAAVLRAGGSGIAFIALSVPEPGVTLAALTSNGGRVIVRRPDGGADVSVGEVSRGWIRVVRAEPPAEPVSGTARPAPGPAVRAIGHLLNDVEEGRTLWQTALGRDVPNARDTTGVPFPPDCGCDRQAYIREVNIGLEGPGINLIAPVGGDSVWRRMIVRYQGLHYLQVAVADPAGLEPMVAQLERAGGRRTLGAPGAPYAYVDLTGTLGVTLLLVRGA